MLEFIRPHASGPLTVAIDAPTIVPNETGMRPVERLLQRTPEFQRAHAAPYPGNRELLGKHNNGIPRGEELVELLKRVFDFQEGGCPPSHHQQRYAMEVFLFGADNVPAFKKKGKRTWEQCRAGLSSYVQRLRGLQEPRLIFSDALRVHSEFGKALKNIEDQVDAVLCAYIAALAWLGKAEAVGDLQTGYIVLPLPRSEEREERRNRGDRPRDEHSTIVEIAQSVWGYHPDELQSWFVGERHAYPRDERLKFWRGTRPEKQPKYQFSETYVATALMRQGYICWTWFELFGERVTSASRERNGEEIRQLLIESGRTFDPRQLASAVEGLRTFRPPDVIAFHPQKRSWRFIEVKRTEKQVRQDQQLSLAAAKHFLNVEAEVIYLRPSLETVTKPSLVVTLRLAGAAT
jgi:predicted RNase H-like nuclease